MTPAKPSLGEDAPSGPVTLLVVDAPALLEGRNSPARDVLAGQGVPACGLVLAPTADQLPALCTSVVELDGAHGAARYREPAFNLTVEPVLVSGMTEELARRCARALSALEDPEVADVGADLPNGVALVDLIGGDVTAEALAKRWKAAGKVPSLAAPIGVYGDGPLELDLVSDGPHALIAGTTGAGKSELLRSDGGRPGRHGRLRAPQLRPHRLQGRLGLRPLRRPAPHRRHGYRPRRAPRGPGAALPRGRASLPGDPATRRRRLRPEGVPPRRPPRAAPPPRRDHRRVRHHGRRAARLHRLAGRRSPSGAGALACT